MLLKLGQSLLSCRAKIGAELFSQHTFGQSVIDQLPRFKDNANSEPDEHVTLSGADLVLISRSGVLFVENMMSLYIMTS